MIFFPVEVSTFVDWLARNLTVSVKSLRFPAVRSPHLLIHSEKCCYHDMSWTAWAIWMKTDREYSLAPTDDLIRFWWSKVKVTTGCQGQILWIPYRMNYMSNLDETYMEYSLSPIDPTDDLLDFGGQRSRSQQAIGASKFIFCLPLALFCNRRRKEPNCW